MSVAIPRGAEREYLIMIGVAAIYVAKLSNSSMLGVTRDLNLSRLELQRRHVGAEITDVCWVRDRDRADAVRYQVHAQMMPCSHPSIVSAAAQLGIGITDHAKVMARVASVARLVEQRIDEASSKGDLGWFNAAFREWRMEAKAAGRVMTYREARARLRRVMMQGLVQLNADVLPEIFPATRPEIMPDIRMRRTGEH
jgi:hypothetical protein